MRNLTFHCLQGQAIIPWLGELARLRIEVFREYPYLYDGNLDYETQYLKTYAASTNSLFVLALDGDAVIGAATAIALADETDEFRQPFIAQGWNPNEIFYFGESVLLPVYRGRGIGVRFFSEREAQAQRLGYRWCCFCAVERPVDHPMRPAGYQPLNHFWHKRGYRHYPALRTEYHWQELGEDCESAKPMSFWLRELP
ncbi:MAG: GNAT family N-acetyltransferase [Marinobacterium sp.]|nr:GNAT family N-acetyltransferase [Marinobacterium sp.]